MPELGTYGSVRGVPSNGHPYRDRCAARTGRLAVDNAHALPTAPAFAHKLHSLLPPSTTRTQSPSGPGSIGAATILTRGVIGQRGLLGPDAPVRHNAKRRRIKTVMQELIYRAGRLIATGRRVILGLGANDKAAKAFIRLHAQFAPTA